MAEQSGGPAAPQKAYMGKRGAGKYRDLYKKPPKPQKKGK